MIFETHAHYEDEQFNEDRETLIQELKDKQIEYVVNVGSNIKTSKQTLELIDQYDFFYGAIGVHPNEVAELDEEKMQWLKEMTKKEKVVAIGEIGLDYYWDEPARDIQKQWFVRQMQLARETNLPMIIHSRDAAKDTADLMKAEKAGEIGGVIHCFSYTKEMAKTFLDMGFYLGFGGVVTFKNAKKVKEVAEYVPLDRMVLETDSPYLAPVPNRGKRNSSLNIPYVAKELAALKNISYEQVLEQTMKNAKQLYRINK